MVRDFTYNEKDIADGKMEISKLEDDKKKQYVSSTANGKLYVDRWLFTWIVKFYILNVF